jgi:hypothetical protein
MKKMTIIGAVLMTAVSLSVYGQGFVQIDNTANTGAFGGQSFNGTTGDPVYSASVTANGLIFTLDTAAQAGHNGYASADSTMLGADVSWALYGGATAGTVTSLIASDTGSQINTPSDDNVNWGQIAYQTGLGQPVPGTAAGATVFLDLQVWEGSTYSTFALAAAASDYRADSGVFSNGSGGTVAGNPVAATLLTGLPDMLLVTSVPEPTTLALFGLGGAALLAFRRRKA